VTATTKPLTVAQAVHLLKRQSNATPSATLQKAVEAKLAHSLLVPVPTALPQAQGVQGLLATSPQWVLLATLVVGIGIGVGLDRLAVPRPQRNVTNVVTLGEPPPKRVQRVPGESTAAALGQAAPRIDVESLPHVPSPPATRVMSRSASDGTIASAPSVSQMQEKESTLREQQALLDQARLALGRGQSSTAMSALELHRARFATSVLAEERDALFIRALAASGNRGEARAQAQAFLARYPHSLLLPAIEGAQLNSE